MTFKNFFCKGVVVAAVFLLIGWLGQYWYLIDGQLDWFRFAILFGILAGIPHMFIVIPGRWGISGSTGMVVFCTLIGGLFGCVIAIYLAARAAFYLAGYPVCQLARALRQR